MGFFRFQQGTKIARFGFIVFGLFALGVYILFTEQWYWGIVLIIIGTLALLILKPFAKKMDDIGKRADEEVASVFRKK